MTLAPRLFISPFGRCCTGVATCGPDVSEVAHGSYDWGKLPKHDEFDSGNYSAADQGANIGISMTPCEGR